MSVLLPIQPGTLPPGACFTSEQQRLNAFSEAQKAVLSGQSYYNFGSTTPAVENNAYPWFRTTDGRWYYFSGDWISPVGPEYHAGVRRLWASSAGSLQTYDGGDTNTPSDRSGPMWTIDSDFDGRSPMGPGAIPTSNPAKTLAGGENYGVGAHVLALSHIPEHRHSVQYTNLTSGNGFPQVGTGDTAAHVFNTDLAGSATPTPLNNVHPVRGLYIIRWTGRLYRRA